MNLITKAYLLQHLIRWRLTWDKRNTRNRFTVPGNPKFMSARDAVQLIKDGDVIATSGIAGNQRMSAMIWAVRELFDEDMGGRILLELAAQDPVPKWGNPE